MHLKKLEIILAGSLAVLAGVLLAVLAPGGAISSDIISYADYALNGKIDLFHLNRVFHVFLGAIFIRISPTPLQGIQYFWAFLVAAVAFLTYLNARLWHAGSTPLHGLVAVAIFFSILPIAEWTGVPWPDLSVALMGMLLLAGYSASAGRAHRSHLLLLFLGVLAYFALRTKETSVIFILVFLGLGSAEDGSFRWQALLRNTLTVLAGVLAGAALFCLVNWSLVGDPFFGYRSAEIGEFITVYINMIDETPPVANPQNWYNGYLLQVTYIPFLLYLISGVLHGTEMPLNRRWVYLIPLAGVLFLIASINANWGFIGRVLFPVFPVMAFLSASLVKFDLPAEQKLRLRSLLLAAGCLIIPVAVRYAARGIVYGRGIDFGGWLDLVFEPVLLTLLLASVFIIKRTSAWSGWITLACLAGLLVNPLLANGHSMLVERKNQALQQFYYYPFQAFESQIAYKPGMRVLISPDIHQIILDLDGEPISGMLSHDNNEIIGMFNIFFDGRTGSGDFYTDTAAYFGQVQEAPVFTYILLSRENWEALTADVVVLEQVERRYHVYIDEQELLVLLAAR